MKISSLFLKIFLCFWGTAIATGIALVITFFLKPGNVPSQWHLILTDTARYTAVAIVDRLDTQGVPAASSYITHLEQQTHLRTCLFDASGTVVSGLDCATFADIVSRVTAAGSSAFGIKYGLARVALRVNSRSGHTYIYATELPAGPRAAFGFSRSVIVLRWCIAFFVSGLICYLLARYLTAPVLRLREASQRLAEGDLSTRATAGMERRHDEIGLLVRDFNAMATRIEGLIVRQRQLFYDISHELRSPLARLNVALDLRRERKGNDPSFDQMEKDIELLNHMLGRLLTVARLDINAAPVAMTRLDITELVSQIVYTAEFEAGKHHSAVRLTADEPYYVNGNAELLHSAIENVVRNAIRYNQAHEPVEVHMSTVAEPQGRSMLRLIVRDYGPGVREADLVNIFQPFFRVADERNPQNNGAGLGLAIADRIIRIHGGVIRARNASPHGLQIEILLPCILNTQLA
jgi:two-component system sensor histidine kinase CpxA